MDENLGAHLLNSVINNMPQIYWNQEVVFWM